MINRPFATYTNQELATLQNQLVWIKTLNPALVTGETEAALKDELKARRIEMVGARAA